MKKSNNNILIFFFALFIFNSTALIHNCSSQWQYVGPNTPIRAMDFSYPYVLAAYNNIYLSSNNGTNWVQSSFPFTGILSLSTGQYGTFAGTASNGIFKSTDNGFNWTQQLNLTNEPVQCIVAIYPWIYAGIGTGNYEGVLFSSNYGSNWFNTEVQNERIYALCSTGALVYAGSYMHGIFFSTNHGGNWVNQSLTLPVLSIAEDGIKIYAGTNSQGVYYSSNFGGNWSQTALSNRKVNVLYSFSPALYAGTDSNGVYLTTNNGQTWSQKNEGLGNLTVNTFISNGYWAFVGTNAGVYRRPIYEMSGITPISSDVPEHFALYQNYPNPFNPTTTIEFSIPKSQFPLNKGGGVSRGLLIKLSIFDITGREITTPVSEVLSPGKYKIVFDRNTLPSGIYFYKLTYGDFSQTKKMILLK